MSESNRVTKEAIEAEIVSEHYFNAAEAADYAPGAVNTVSVPGELPASLALLTFCVLVLRNGFTVTGQSACVDPANFDANIGAAIARENAIEKLWPLLGFRLADRLTAGKMTLPAKEPSNPPRPLGHHPVA